MNKEETVDALEKAKKRHIDVMETIVSLIDGESIQSPPAVNKMECEFGKILYGNEEKFKYILGLQFWERMDSLHVRWHQEYIKIHNIFFEAKKTKGLFSRMLGSNKVDSLEYDKAKLYYSELRTTTNELVKLLDMFIRRVLALSDTKFED